MKDEHFYTRALKLNPKKSLEYYIERAKFYVFIKEYEKALFDFQKAKELGANLSSELDYKICLAYKNADKNILKYSEKINTNPNTDKYYIKRSELYKLKKVYDLAFLDISKAINLHPNIGYYKILDQLCEEIKEDNVNKAIKHALETEDKKIIFKSYMYKLNLCENKIIIGKNISYWKDIALRNLLNDIYNLLEDKAIALYIFSKFYYRIQDIDYAIYYCKKAIEKSREQKNNISEYLYNIELISLYVNNNKFEKAMELSNINIEKPENKNLKKELIKINEFVRCYIDVFEGDCETILNKENLKKKRVYEKNKK